MVLFIAKFDEGIFTQGQEQAVPHHKTQKLQSQAHGDLPSHLPLL